MAEVDHNRILAIAAKSTLHAMGLRQKGRSRTWLDDHGWWVGVVEFQPSAWSKGSYLNVAACWLWAAKESFSFDYASMGGDCRIVGFRPFESPKQFESDVTELATRAQKAISMLRVELSSISAAAEALRRKKARQIWDHYHAGVAAGLVGDVAFATRCFDRVELDAFTFNWVLKLKQATADLRRSLTTPATFSGAVNSIVRDSRSRLKLSKLDNNPIEI